MEWLARRVRMPKSTGKGKLKRRQRSLALQRAQETSDGDDGTAEQVVECRTKQKFEVRGGAKEKGKVNDVRAGLSTKGKGTLRMT